MRKKEIAENARQPRTPSGTSLLSFFTPLSVVNSQ